MARRLIAGLILAGLAIGVWVLWPKGDSDTATTTPVPLAVATTTPSVVTTTATSTTTTPLPDSHVVTSVEEAEEILRELWFGWFEGIYNQDEDRIREVVGSQSFLDAGRNAFGSLAFTREPASDAVEFQELEVLVATEDCLAVWSESSADRFLGPGSNRTGVDILRWKEGGWLLVSTWSLRGDLWESDCKAELEPLS